MSVVVVVDVHWDSMGQQVVGLGEGGSDGSDWVVVRDGLWGQAKRVDGWSSTENSLWKGGLSGSR